MRWFRIGAGRWLRIPLGKLRTDPYVPPNSQLVELLAAWTAANLEHIRRHKRLITDHRGPLDRHIIGRIVHRVANSSPATAAGDGGSGLPGQRRSHVSKDGHGRARVRFSALGIPPVGGRADDPRAVVGPPEVPRRVPRKM